ncbi:MAG: hypothetical protein Q4C65_06815 [Eubacteriales bacterium]|nr:hypothetical protein [Eubacteriales bacterium]
MKAGKKKNKAVIPVILVTVLLCAGVGGSVLMANAALENERSDEVRSVHVSDGEIEEATLVIGSHLIYLGAMTDELYEIAADSEAEFNQYDMYYKSELAGGSWYEISSATSIEEITSAGTPVNKSVIEELEFTHHTKSDGVTYDLRTGSAVSAFDINPPYDLEAMEELEPLRLQYQMLQEKDEDSKTDSDLVYIDMIGEFFQSSIRDETTDDCDRALRGLHGYKLELTVNDAESAMTDTVDSVMGQVDARRRVQSLTTLSELLDVLELHAGGMNTEEEEEEKARKKEIAAAAREDAEGYMDSGEYDRAVERLQEAFDETGLPQLEEELKDARVERELHNADEAKKRLEEEIRGWRQERSDKEEQAERLKDTIDDLADQISDTKKELEDATDPEEIDRLEQQLADLNTERDEAESEYDSARNRVEELTEQLEEENLERTTQERLQETVKSLTDLYEELKDTRLYNKIVELGETTDFLEADPEKDLTFTVNADVVAAIGDSIQNVQESILKYEAKQLTEGSTLISRLEYRYSTELIENGKQENHAACDGSVENLIDLGNVVEGKVVNRERELAFLDASAVPEGYQAYQQALGAGVSQEYRDALSDSSSKVVLSRLLEQQQSETNSLRLEYQTFLDAKTLRMDNAAAGEYLLTLIDGIGELEGAVNQDASAAYQSQTVSEHLDWLKKAYADLTAESGDDGGMSGLQQEKEALQEALQDALDKNDLAEAARQEALLSAKQQDIDDLEASLLATMQSDSASRSDRARAEAALGEGSVASNLNQIASDLAEAIRDGSTEGLESKLAAIEAAGELDSASAQDALSQVEEALEEALALDSENVDQEALEALREQAQELGEQLSGGTGTDGILSAQELEDLLESLLGGPFDSLSFGEQAACLLAVEWYGEDTRSGEIANLAAQYARTMEQAGNSYIYSKYKQEIREYASLQALGRVLGYRYIFDDTEQTVTLQRGKAYFQFDAGKKEFLTAQETGELSREAALQGTLYIAGKDCETLFSCEAEYIDKASLGLIATADVRARAEEIYSSLTGGGRQDG